MKKYIRLDTGKIIDTTKNTSEVFGETDTFKIVEDNIENIVLKKHWSQVSTKPGYYYCYNSKYEVVGIAVATSDDILELVKNGDLVRIEFTSDDYAFSRGTITLSEIADEDELYELINNLENEDLDLLELYTKQGNNYVLVWDKEKGVI